jgi:hypothetical protein
MVHGEGWYAARACNLPFKHFLDRHFQGWLWIFFKIDTINGARQNEARACGVSPKIYSMPSNNILATFLTSETVQRPKFWEKKKPYFHTFNVKNRHFNSIFDQEKVKILIQNIIYFCIFLHFTTFIRRLKTEKIWKYWHLWGCIVYLLNFFKIDAIHGARRYAARARSACLCYKGCIFCLSTIFLWLYWHPRQYIDQNFEKTVFSYVFGQKLTFQVNFWPTKSENFVTVCPWTSDFAT